MPEFYGNKRTFFESLIKASRKVELEYEMVAAKQTPEGAKVRQAVANYLEGYAEFNRITPESALASYMAFNRSYIDDMKAYFATSQYPLQKDPVQREIGRTDYDLTLLLSILLTPHRCAIMEEVKRYASVDGSLVIGVGSGLEIGFIGDRGPGNAFDLYINGFARQAFPDWTFHEELYRPGGNSYSSIYAIEILEHLSDPYDLVRDCYLSLNAGGKFVTTTASHVPQFDHRYNFVSDEEFEGRMKGLGFEMEFKRVIPHEYGLMNIRAQSAYQPRNVFYVFRK